MVDIYKEKFIKINRLERGTYECCYFESCDFSEQNFSENNFVDCTFKGCNLSMIKTFKLAIRNVSFDDCKMLGINFQLCNPIGLELQMKHCNLSHCNFSGLKIPKTTFDHCLMSQCEFNHSDLSEATFNHCDFTDAHFENSNLEKCDFSLAQNFQFDINQNKIKGSKFSQHQLPALLSAYQLKISD